MNRHCQKISNSYFVQIISLTLILYVVEVYYLGLTSLWVKLNLQRFHFLAFGLEL